MFPFDDIKHSHCGENSATLVKDCSCCMMKMMAKCPAITGDWLEPLAYKFAWFSSVHPANVSNNHRSIIKQKPKLRTV